MYSYSIPTSILVCSFILLSGFHHVYASRPSPHRRDDGYNAHFAEIDPNASNHQKKFQSFVTRPDIDAPRWDVTIYDEEALAPGYWFVAPYTDPAPNRRGGNWVGPHIYDGKGQLIWSGVPMFKGYNAFGFRMSNFNGEDMLSMVYRHQDAIIMDNHYEIHTKAHVEEGFDLNMHEFNIVDNGTRLLLMRTVGKKTTRENSASIDFDGKCNVRFYGFEERDGTTLEPVFTWLSEGVVPLDDSSAVQNPVKKRCSDGWDYM